VARRAGVVVTGAEIVGELEAALLGANDAKAKLSLPADPSAFVEEGAVAPG